MRTVHHTLASMVLLMVVASTLLTLTLASPALANGYEVYPYPLAWSRDSSQLAVCLPLEFDGSTAGGPLMVFDRHGRLRLELADAVYSSPSFHPSGGGRLAVVADGALLDIDVASGEAAVLVDSGVLDCAWYRRDGEDRLAYAVGERFGAAEIYIMPEGGEPWQLTDTGGQAASIAPAPSPGGEYLVFTRMPGREGDSGYERLWTYDNASSTALKLAREERREWDYHESNPVYPFNDWVIFQRGGWGDWRLYRLDLKTGKEYLELTDAQQPSVSDGGQFMGFTRRAYEQKLGMEYDWEVVPAVWLMDRATRAHRMVSTPGRMAQYPAVSPDGERLAWVEEQWDGTLRVMVRGTAGLLGRFN